MGEGCKGWCWGWRTFMGDLARREKDESSERGGCMIVFVIVII